MAEFRPRRRPDPPTFSDTDAQPLVPASILRQPAITPSKKVQFHPETVFHCRHLRYRRAKLRTHGMFVSLCVVLGVSFWWTFGAMSERQAKFAKEGVVQQNDGQSLEWGQVRPGALGSFAESSGNDLKRGEQSASAAAAETKQQTANQQTANQHTVNQQTTAINTDKCQFRTYPPNRLYGLSSSNQRSFLSEATYIRGQYPIILHPSSKERTATKLCIDTTSWENLSNDQLPFTDGHNPSIISLDSNRIDHVQYLEPISKVINSLDSLYMAITVFGSGQCKFGLSPEQVNTYHFSTLEGVPNGKRAVISIHSSPESNPPFNTILQTTLLLEQDSRYGSNKRALPPSQNGTIYNRIHVEFDDPRFFFHNRQIWVLYRNGPLFGYNDQIHNPVHFEYNTVSGALEAHVKASETVRVCCGRNIALISQDDKLKALTWVDPVTVVDVPLDTLHSSRRLGEASINHRRLKGKPKSHIHGTNGYMIPLPNGELLGIAHFHRPEDRKSSEYALHGHHYTHAFFTIRQSDTADEENKFELKRLSNEFMFQAQYSSVEDATGTLYQDGDIIQFASGLDVVGDTLIISYGINDCEGAVLTLEMSRLNELLIGVQPGLEVVDLMSRVAK
ncbi:hypothetical protein ACHAXN_003853 [Cyclotella atomus]